MRILIAFGKNEDSCIVKKVTDAVKASRPGDEIVTAAEEWTRVKNTSNNLLAAYRMKLHAGGGAFKPRTDFDAWPSFVANGRRPDNSHRFDALIVPANISQAILVNGVAAVEYGKTTLGIVAAFVEAGKEFSVVCHTDGIVVETLPGSGCEFRLYDSGSYEEYGCLMLPKVSVSDSQTVEDESQTDAYDYASFGAVED